MLHVRSAQDFAAGILFVAIGLGGVFFGRDLTFGSAGRMGPGFFPMIVSGLITTVGVAVVMGSLVVHGPPIRRFGLRPIIFVNAALLTFGFAIEALGLAVTTVAMTFVAALARHDTKWPETILFGIALSAFAVGVFIYGLGQPMRPWWELQ